MVFHSNSEYSVPKLAANGFVAASVLVVGDVMLDRYWFGDVERISPEAPVPVVLVGQTQERLGGAANVALNAATLGARVALLGGVGQDEAGERVQALLVQHGVHSALQTDPNCPTTVKLRVVARQQQLARIDFEKPPSAHVLAACQQQFAALCTQHAVVLFSDYGKGVLEGVAVLMQQAKAQQKIILVDPKGEDYRKYQGASVLTPNRSEFRQVVGRWSSEAEFQEKAFHLREALQLQALLVTRSEEGMTLFDAQGVFHVPAQAREVFDVSGAGDTVIATLACAVGAGLPLRQAVVLANRAGAVVVGKLGTAVVHPEELNEV